MPDTLATHIVCAFGAGFAACVVGSPVDVLKTCIMNNPDGGNPFRVIYNMMTKEGPLAFYKGFTANFMRIGSWNIVMFVALEQIKGLFPTE